MNPYPLGEHEERFEPKNDLKLPKLEEKLALQSQAPQEATLSSFVDSVSTTAFHNSDAITDSCYPGTRTQLLAGLDKWASTNVIGGENPYIVWLTGIAGSGKTAIMQTFAERASERVSASFFFCRSDARRNDTKYLLPTLLYQLYHSVPHPQKSRILSSVPLFPLVRNRPLSEQFDILVLNPLRDLFESGHFSDPESRPVIIIDGLDECLDQEKQLEVMDMLFHAIKAGVPFQFLLSSRPDPRIQSVVSAQSPGSAMCQIVLDDTRQNDLDIRLFLEQRMHECRTTHPFRKYLPPDLPSDKDIDHLVYMSSRLFIFASTAMRYIESPRDLPATRLANILGLYADGDQPHAQLDALYAHILQTTSNSAQLLRILALIALSNNRLPISIIAATLQIPPRECEGFLLEIPSLVSVCNQDKLSYINMRHTSLLDFLRDRSRSQEYGIRISDYNAQIIQASTRFVIRK
ncbi:hypothetical protein D9619_002160 [Psilocybe cf. subviscida]|uniref:NACHT domain-containing protein n=1 Tax=Psilocybe cf. subviscida TaxID=2480587 RepID=A0A8H5BFC9_9AGAR|nr:hypothetical protein D9619_002160 [Psilocybe cf. subviscida]